MEAKRRDAKLPERGDKVRRIQIIGGRQRNANGVPLPVPVVRRHPVPLRPCPRASPPAEPSGHETALFFGDQTEVDRRRADVAVGGVQSVVLATPVDRPHPVVFSASTKPERWQLIAAFGVLERVQAVDLKRACVPFLIEARCGVAVDAFCEYRMIAKAFRIFRVS